MIEPGADVTFIETSHINEWTAPVLHDCIKATIYNCYTLQENTDRFDEAFSLLHLMVDRKADPNQTDSYGNTCLHRAIMDARQLIEHPNADLTNGILLAQLRKVFDVLVDNTILDWGCQIYDSSPV